MKNLQELKEEILRNTEEWWDILVDEWIYEDIEEYMEEQRWTLDNSISLIRENIKEKLETIWLEEEEISLILSNFDTNWTASLTILDLLWFNLSEDKEDENAKIILVWELNEIEREEIEGLLEAMRVAHYRHNCTNYDNINKSNMSNEQVARLRKCYN